MARRSHMALISSIDRIHKRSPLSPRAFSSASAASIARGKAMSNLSSLSTSIAFTNNVRVDFDRRLSFECIEACAPSVQIHRSEDDAPTDEALIGWLNACRPEVIINKEIPLSAHLIEQLPPSVRLIQEAGTGYNNIDLAAAKANGITVCNVPAYSTQQMGQLAMTLVLSLSASLCQQQRMLERGDVDNFESHVLHVPHFELEQKTLGLVGGLGDTGGATAAIARSLGMRVLNWSRSKRGDASRGIEAVDSLEELMAASDFVSLHCPLNDATRGLVNRDNLKLMKPTSYLVNISRGGLIEEADLIEALQNKAIAGAALDVQESESPWAVTSQLFSMDNVVLTPHIGWKRLETRQVVLLSKEPYPPYPHHYPMPLTLPSLPPANPHQHPQNTHPPPSACWRWWLIR